MDVVTYSPDDEPEELTQEEVDAVLVLVQTQRLSYQEARGRVLEQRRR
jgi:hypothetical protein